MRTDTKLCGAMTAAKPNGLMKEFADIVLLDCRCLRDPALFAAALGRMDDTRQAKIRAWDSAEDKRLSLGAGVLAQFLLLRRDLDPKRLYFDEAGKPRIGGSALHISLSHAGDWAMAGLSSAPVAVDIEKHRPDEWGIAAHFYTEAERVAMEADPDPAVCFWRLWSRKECLIKRDGLRDLRGISVLEDPPGGRFRDFALPGYSCVACVEEGITPALLELDPMEILKAI